MSYGEVVARFVGFREEFAIACVVACGRMGPFANTHEVFPAMTITRRGFLGSSAALFAGVASAADEAPIIDTHTHFYDPTRKEGVPWPGKDDKVLYRPVLPAEFKKLVKPHGVTGTVIVEASPWVKDNDWLLDLAKDDPFIVGIVGHLHPHDDTARDSAGTFAPRLKHYASQPKYRGIRLNSNVIAKADEHTLKNIGKLIDANLTLDINGGPDMLPTVAKLAERYPKLRIVVNHMANVPILGEAPPKMWVEGMQALAKHTNVWCKMSALVESTRLPDAPKKLDHYLPTLNALWQALGEDRLVFGSDWPVSDRFAKYETVFQLAHEFLERQGKAARQKVMGRNARQAYQLA